MEPRVSCWLQEEMKALLNALQTRTIRSAQGDKTNGCKNVTTHLDWKIDWNKDTRTHVHTYFLHCTHTLAFVTHSLDSRLPRNTRNHAATIWNTLTLSHIDRNLFSTCKISMPFFFHSSHIRPLFLLMTPSRTFSYIHKCIHAIYLLNQIHISPPTLLSGVWSKVIIRANYFIWAMLWVRSSLCVLWFSFSSLQYFYSFHVIYRLFIFRFLILKVFIM